MRIPAFALEGAALGTFALLAGSAFLFTNYGSRAFPPLTLTALRLSLGSSLLLVLQLAGGCLGGCGRTIGGASALRKVTGHEVRLLAAVGLANTAVPYTLYAAAQAEGIGVGVAAVLSSATPLFAACLAALLLPDGAGAGLAHPASVVGVLVGLAGALLMALAKEALEGTRQGSTGSGIALQTAGVASKALACVLMERHSRRVQCGVVTQALLQAAAGAALSVVMALCLDCSGHTPRLLDPKGLGARGCGSTFALASVQAWGSVAYLGVCSSCIVYVIQFFLLRRVGAVRQTLVDYLTPLVGIAEGLLLKGEWGEAGAAELLLSAGGAVLILAGVFILRPGPLLGASARGVRGHLEPLANACGEAPGMLGSRS